MKKDYKFQKGQTLLEVVAALGIAVVVIGSILGLITASNRKATLARQTSEATKLVQEGLEIIRNIRDTDAPSVYVGWDFTGATACNSMHHCTFDQLYSGTQNTVNSHLQGITLVDNLTTPFEGPLLGIFRRTVIIQDDFGANPICSPGSLGNPVLVSNMVKRVTVRVEWDSPSGTQFKEGTTCLTRWR